MLGQRLADDFIKTVTDCSRHSFRDEAASPLGERTHAEGHNLGAQHSLSRSQGNLFPMLLSIGD